MVRTVSAGERLRVTDLLRTPQDEWYYRVVDGDTIGYVVADTVVPERTNAEDITLGDWSMEDHKLSGMIRSENLYIDNVEVVVTEYGGSAVLRQRLAVNNFQKDLADFNEMLDFSALKEGAYTVSVYATTRAAYTKLDKLAYSNVSRLMDQRLYLVGEATIPAEAKSKQPKEDKDGWYWRDGVWSLYKNDKPQSGWVQDLGVWYYLNEDGTVTTGKATIGEREYLFSATGALRVGWMENGRNTCYVLDNGDYATGWQIIENSRYYFDPDGNMVTRGSLVDGEITYDFQKDGKAIARAEVTAE